MVEAVTTKCAAESEHFERRIWIGVESSMLPHLANYLLKRNPKPYYIHWLSRDVHVCQSFNPISQFRSSDICSPSQEGQGDFRVSEVCLSS